MNKSHELKKEQHYQSNRLRGKITESIKQIRDSFDGKFPQSSDIPIIPVTGKKAQKYLHNKSYKPE